MTAVALQATVFADRARRARDLIERHPYAAEALGLFAALADAQGPVYERARADRPAAADLVAYAVRVGLPAVMDATMAAGTELLRESVVLRFHDGELERIVTDWLRGEEQSGADAFLARAATSPILEALPDVAASLRPAERDERTCPACGGLPQLAVFTESGEALVTGQRQLLCSRCAGAWIYPRMTCVSCGESGGAKMPILSDPERLPHVRIDACDSCRRYLLTVDERKEPGCMPLVDEIAALPLDLAAAERGYTKIVRNVMGF